MKKIVTVLALLIGITTFAQDKNAKASLEVDGVCGMCKARIEKACLGTKGVKHADWNVETHELQVIFDERKTNVEIVKNEVLAAGHDLMDRKASDEAYAKVHNCCKYRNEEVRDDHKAKGKN